MARRISAVLIAAVLIGALTVIPVLAEPYVTGGIKVGEKEKSYIEAVLFDGDGNYHETGATNANYSERPEMEDEGGPQTEGGSSGFGNIGWTSAGEWVQYTINVINPGRYKFEAMLASGTSPAGNINVLYNDNLIGNAVSENLGGSEPWQEYAMYDVGEIDLAESTGVIKVEFVNGAVNFAVLEVTALFEIPTEPPPPPEPEPEPDGGAEAPADGGAADPAPAQSGGSNDDDDGNGMIIGIIIAVVAVIAIAVIAVVVTKKKK